MKTYFSLGVFILVLAACGQKPEKAAESPAGKTDSSGGANAADAANAGTPVTVTSVSQGVLNEYIELNAVSTFLQKSYVKANTNGYLQTNDVYLGKYVEVGQSLFTLKTKEAQSIGNSIKILDSTLHFSGVNHINASQRGYITQLNHQTGDYVQDGEQLAVISDRNSFVFLLNLPYEWRPYVLGRRLADIVLPDGEKLSGTIGAAMPTMDSASQTQNVIIRVNTGSNSSQQVIPENLIAKVRILKTAGSATQSLPKSAVLSDETENNFWVMKMIDSVTAVKIPVKKGIETQDKIEILSPVFTPSDRILVSGNYGLPDTAKVNPAKQP